MKQFWARPVIRAVLSAGLMVSLLTCLSACLNPDPPAKPPPVPTPLDSLPGYFEGTIVRTICKQPNVPAPDSCGLMENDTTSAVTSRISLQGSNLSFFLPGFGTLDIMPGDTVYADSADTVGEVLCFRIPDQTVARGSGGIVSGEVLYEHAEGGEVCPGASDTLAPFTIRPKGDPQLLNGQRRLFRLHRAAPPPPPG